MNSTITSRTPRRLASRAFTLIEIAVAQVIVGFAITAMCQLLGAGTSANMSASDMTAALGLANSVHELAIGLPLEDSGKPMVGSYHDVWDLDGITFSPPINAGGTPIPSAGGWSQQVAVQTFSPADPSATIVSNRTSPAVRLTVSIFHGSRFVYSANWLLVAPDR